MSLHHSLIAAVLSAGIAGAGMVRAGDTSRAGASPSAAIETPLVWPDRLRGQVLNEAGESVAGATVTLGLMREWARSVGGVFQTTTPIATATAGADGRYEIDPAGFPASVVRPFGLHVTAAVDGYATWEGWVYHGVGAHPDWPHSVGDELPTVRVAAGRTVRGLVVGADGRPAAAATLWGYEGARQGSWGDAIFRTDAEGRFEFVAPTGKSVGVWVVSADWAPKFVLLPEQADEPLRITLEAGTKIEGTLHGRDGRPVAGAVVVAESADRGKIERYSLPVERVTKTDAEGRFRLPPVAGTQLLYVTTVGRPTERPRPEALVADGPVPPVPPQYLTVGPGPIQSVELRETTTAVISGTARWADGGPAAGAKVISGVTSRGNRAWIQFQDVYTDDEGRYEITVPVPLDEVGLMAHQFVRKDLENTARGDGWGERYSLRLAPVVEGVPERDLVFPVREPMPAGVP